MPQRVAINGFGRIGRNIVRAVRTRDTDIELVAINDIADADALGHLLKYDSVYGPYPGEIEVDGDRLLVTDAKGTLDLRVCSEADPADLPWGELGVDTVIESTGRFRTRAEAAGHLTAGAERVVISAPASDPDVTVVLGVNFEQDYDPASHRVISNASCTTNCLAPVAKILHDTVGIRHGLMTTIHGYTADQRLHDMPHKDPRRARAAALNLIPTSTGAAKAIGIVLPELAGKLHGFAVRAPIPTGSIVDLTIEAARPTSAEEINAAFEAQATGAMAGILQLQQDPIVSSDIVGSDFSSIVDAQLTSVIDETMVKVIAWYDNEWGYARRLVDLVPALEATSAAVSG